MIGQIKDYKILRVLVALLPCLLFLGISCADRQRESSEIRISGTVPHANDSSFVAFDRYFEENTTNQFPNYDSVPIIDGHFQKTFGSSGTTVISLASSEAIPSIHLICDGDEDIGLTIKRSPTYFDVTFTGKNAKGHDLIFESSLFRIVVLTLMLDDAMEQGVDSPQTMIGLAEGILDSLVAPFDDLLKKDLITSTFYDRVKTQTESKMLGAVHHVMAHAYRYPNTSTLQKDAIDTVLVHFFTKFDPFSERYLFDLGGNRAKNAEDKCRLIARGLLSGNREELGIWPPKFEHNAFAPVELQEKIMASQLIFSRMYEENPVCEDFQRYRKFKRAFPESAYNAVLQARYFDRLDCDSGGSREDAIYPYASLGPDSLALIAEYQNKTLDSLLHKQFTGKRVFVDLWATWCAPCIQEFGFVDEVKPELDKLGIEALYVSLDPLRARKNWEKAIHRYRLRGSHFLIGNTIDSTLRANLGEKAEITIPRYLLIDEQGRIVDGDLPRPSSGKLIDRLQELSNTKH